MMLLFSFLFWVGYTSHAAYMPPIEKLSSEILKNLTIITLPPQKKEEPSWLKDRIPLITESILGTREETTQDAYQATKEIKNTKEELEFTNAAKTLTDKIRSKGKTKGPNELRTAALMLGLYAKRTYPDSALHPLYTW